MKKQPTKRTRKRRENNAPEQTAPHTKLPESDPKRKPFVPQNLDRTVIAIPLLEALKKEEEELAKDPTRKPEPHKVIIDLNLEFPGGRDAARDWVIKAIRRLTPASAKYQALNEAKNQHAAQYVFARLEGEVIRKLVRLDHEEHRRQQRKGATAVPLAIFHIWPDFKIKVLINRSVSTVKADAARASFAAFGEQIVWAVLDSGIEADHPHFKAHENLKLPPPLEHKDFTEENNPTNDPNGHGTHVAGIIAGELPATNKKKRLAYVRNRDENGNITYNKMEIQSISGMAPKCKLVSLRVLNDEGEGDVSSLIAAISWIQEINGHGRRLLIHGINMSVGNDFEPEWFACGQSPLCVEVNRLVSSGVVVVAAAGNSGYGSLQSTFTGEVQAGLSLTINDPGNADKAITVGSTHRDMPHIYGVSYFSSKGPTGDGRAKPDLVAPGEKIVSCAAGSVRERVKAEAGDCDYTEDSGTSMAAPHVSGVIAAFLSIRQEFIGRPEEVKKIFLDTATDLRRERYFQGYGLVDLMRAIQSV